MITLELDFVMADLLRSVLDEKLENMRWEDFCDAIDFERIREIRDNIDNQMKNNG